MCLWCLSPAPSKKKKKSLGHDSSPCAGLWAHWRLCRCLTPAPPASTSCSSSLPSSPKLWPRCSPPSRWLWPATGRPGGGRLTSRATWTASCWRSRDSGHLSSAGDELPIRSVERKKKIFFAHKKVKINGFTSHLG